MVYYTGRIDRAYLASPQFFIDDRAKIIIMSDCHRGTGNLTDDFAKNQNVCYAALRSYNDAGFTYIEAGDGDELWKNKSFAEISSTHADIFSLLAQFYRDKRLWMLYGNHDIEKLYKPRLMDTYNSSTDKRELVLFPGMTVREGIRLGYRPAGREIFILHGHQADFFNDRLWWLARFLVRYVWRPLELIGFSDPKSAAKNNKVKEKVEKRLAGWANAKNIMVLAGHTHRAVFPSPAEGLYFNDGSCVHPWSITAVEITGGAMTLVRWRQKTREDGTVYIGKDVIAGPSPLKAYWT